MNILGGLLAFFVSTCVSVLNGFNTRRILKKKNSNRKVFLAFALRQVINFGLLLAAFLLRNCLPFSLLSLLIGTAMGIIIPTVIFAVCFSKKIKAKL